MPLYPCYVYDLYSIYEGIKMSNESISKELSVTLPIGKVKSRKKREEQLYEPIKSVLQRELEEYLNSQKERIGEGFIGKVHLEITAKGHFSEDLKEELDDDALNIIRVEKFSPDIMGFMQKSQYSKELITVEVKPDKITIKNISRAKLYQEIFKATYGMLISPKRIPEEIRRFISNRYGIRGNIIIAQFDKANNKFKFNKKLYPTIPEPFIPKA